jgi:uncharacterized membrane protein YqiK
METPGIGHNNPPLAEMLVEETADLSKRAADLLAGAARATVTDRETAEKATLLVGIMKAFGAKVEELRDARKKPFWDAGKMVDAHFKALRSKVVGEDPNKLGGEAARIAGLVDQFRRDEEARAAAERRRLEDEARAEREKAEAAARAQREAEERERLAAEESARKIREAEAAARRAGNAATQAEVARLQQAAAAEIAKNEAAARERRLQAELQQERAAALDRQAAATVAVPINAGNGVKAHRRTVWSVAITDLNAAIKHARKLDEAAIQAVVQNIYDRQVRAGVRTLPGAEVTEDSATSIRTGS